MTSNTFVLSISPTVPANTLPEFVELARRAAPPLAYASAGIGSQHQMLMEMLAARAGIKLLHVPFRGGARAHSTGDYEPWRPEEDERPDPFHGTLSSRGGPGTTNACRSRDKRAAGSSSISLVSPLGSRSTRTTVPTGMPRG